MHKSHMWVISLTLLQNMSLWVEQPIPLNQERFCFLFYKFAEAISILRILNVLNFKFFWQDLKIDLFFYITNNVLNKL